MKAIDPNYVPPERTFAKYQDGKYKVNGVEWFTLDAATKRPILVAQKDQKLVGRLRFKLVGEVDKDGPPMSLVSGEMALLAKAFGISVTDLPKLPGENQPALMTSYMEAVRDGINSKKKELEVTVAGGWVNAEGVPGMGIPEGYFHFHLANVTGDKDSAGNPAPKQGQYGKFFYVTFQIDFAEGGRETLYRGAEWTELVPYAVKVENGKADWDSDDEGNPTLNATRLSKLMRLTAPELFVDEFNPPDPYNLLPYWRNHAVPNQILLKGSRVREQNGPRIKLVWSTLDIVEGAEPVKQPRDELSKEDKVRQVLVEALDNIAGAKTTVNGGYDLTEAGKTVAKQYLSPLKKAGQIQHGSLDKLTIEEVETILTSLGEVANLDKSYKERVVMLGVGFEPAGSSFEDEDTPF